MSDDILSATTAEIPEAGGAQGHGIESSPTSTFDVKSTESSTVQGADAKSPTAKAPADVKKATMLEKVKEVLIGKKASADASTAASKVGEGDKKPEQKVEQKPEGEAKAEVPVEFAKHPAWQRILKERDGFKAESTQYRQVQKFLDENGVSGNDAAEALKLTALVYNNPQEALQRLDAFRAKLAVRVGAELPSDLNEAVKSGQLSEAHAKELSAARMRTTDAETRAKNTEEKLSQADSAREFEERGRVFDGWSATTGKTDPDLAKKLPLMNGVLAQLKTAHGAPRDSADVLARLNFAHKEVTSQIRGLVPQKPAKESAPIISGSTAQVKPAPTTMKEQVAAVLNKRR